ncbi:retrotransposable element [Pimephales promelas]|nr:retrotransposable element [Pimephales promelas]
MQLTAELTSQTSRLDLHHQQLSHLTTITEQLVQTFQELRTAAGSIPSTPATPPPPSVPPDTVSTAVNPRLAFPDKFDGTPTKCKGFLLQCTLFVEQQPALYASHGSRIAFVCSLLTGRALEWATAVWRPEGNTFARFQEFIQQFRQVFEHTTEKGDAADQLLNLTQGKETAADYALTFRTLAAQTNWVEDTLKTLFRRGLTNELQSELACRDEGKTLNEYITLAIQVDNLMRSRRKPRVPVQSSLVATNHPEPMQLGLTHISPEELEALDGHPIGEGKIQRVTERIQLHIGSLHSENIQFYVIHAPHHSIILGHPWLQTHNPHISWKEGQIIRWGEACNHHCLSKVTRVCNPEPESDTTSSEPENLPSVYADLSEAFSKAKAAQLPEHRSTDCAIDLIPGATPPRGRIFPLSKPESDAMKKYIEEELAKGFIRPSTSPAAAGFFFVKKDGGLRPCIDYRGLNEITVKYRYLLPLVPAALEQLRQAKYYTKLDLRNAYNLIRIREGDEWKTAFSTTSGHYEYLVMPFGLSNSPSVFQAFMNDVFRDMLDKWFHLYAKNEKCEFHQTSISFLGYIISQEGVAMDEKKVKGVVDWPLPQTIKELQRFLGFANFYRRFIRNFSLIAAPLTALTKRHSHRISWNPEAQQAFHDLKTRFTTAPILHHPDPERQFIVEVDASNTGVGAILSQRQGDPAKMYPCAFFSRKLSPAERNYDVGNRELLAMKLALEEWRHWLEGAAEPFIILTDHINLEYLRSAKRLNPRQARWALFFTRFNFTVTYRPGTKNTKADALSRQTEETAQNHNPENILGEKLLVAPVQWDIMTEIQQTNRQTPIPAECPANLLYVPETLRARLLDQVHSSPSSGHPGITATVQLLQNRFWWPTLTPDTINHIHNCSHCQTSKSPRTLPAGLLCPLPTPQRPWSHIAVDFITDLPNSQGYTTILTIVDRFSKACRLVPLTKLPTAFETAELLCNQVFRFYGLPEDIVSDRGPQFTSRVWTSFFKNLNVNISLTSGYHPQSNGQTERLNQDVIRFLRTYCQQHQQDWSRYLFWAEYAQNSLVKPATGITPFKCILGFQPPLFPWSGEPTELPSVTEWLHKSEEVWDQAHTHLRHAVRRQEHQANRHRRPAPVYQIGQWVWLSTRDLRLRLPCRKLSPRYVGPFQIIRQISPVSFRLDLPANYRISPTFHVSLLKPAGGPRGEAEGGTTSQKPPPILVDGEEAYRVHKLLDSRRRGNNLQYLVDWEGYGPEEQSWVSSRDILDPTLTEEFHRTYPEKPAPRPRGRPRRQLPPRVRSRSQGGGLCYSGGSRSASSPPPEGAFTGVLIIGHKLKFPSYLLPGTDCVTHLHRISTHIKATFTHTPLRSLDLPRRRTLLIGSQCPHKAEKIILPILVVSQCEGCILRSPYLKDAWPYLKDAWPYLKADCVTAARRRTSQFKGCIRKGRI